MASPLWSRSLASASSCSRRGVYVLPLWSLLSPIVEFVIFPLLSLCPPHCGVGLSRLRVVAPIVDLWPPLVEFVVSSHCPPHCGVCCLPIMEFAASLIGVCW